MNAASQILVGIDFSPSSRNALLTTLRLAKARKAKVTALHVMDPDLAGAIKAAHGFSETSLHAFMIERLRAFLDAPDAAVEHLTFEFDIGPDFVTLIHWCNKLKAELLVLGSRGRTHTTHQIGAIAARCARQAPADVLLVREDTKHPFRHIVACVDFSETSAKAVRHAAEVADIEGGNLDCLFINQTALAMSLDYAGYLPAVEIPDTTSTEHWKGELERFREPLIPAPVAPRAKGVVLERVNVRDAIYEHINTTGADLVVLGTRGVTNLRTLVMGTTAERIITNSPCSVLAVKPEGYEFQAH
ncbi:nucleotide-binding universal stress UspA family protein [Roseimicrobium gellanilyticum]|uniref:Nucleotide-binding universal stress UspA family protein n=1 Tax=Roseimicrobium gellanilyticum TaxID=748857 RepID=A0A366HT90_9BACT|nr:universal stress protein [Roseimicrobium gellanilyticum]RBP46469.1 nucleotide-binding universal stress UspA family protein [Roseimicrobium gellanilyticum]